MQKHIDLYQVIGLCAVALGCSRGAQPQATSAADQPAANGPTRASGSPAAIAVPTADPTASASSGIVDASTDDAPGSFGAGDAAVALPPQSPPDPNVTFDWKQTESDPSDCRPGTYSGTFMCEVVAPGLFDPGSGPIGEGPIAITLTKSQNGEFLEISDGHLQARDPTGVVDIQARIVGKLDCSTNMLDGMAVDGTYGVGDANAAPSGTLEGKITGTLDRTSATLSGTWSIDWDALGYVGSCNGPFTATWMP